MVTIVTMPSPVMTAPSAFANNIIVILLCKRERPDRHVWFNSPPDNVACCSPVLSWLLCWMPY